MRIDFYVLISYQVVSRNYVNIPTSSMQIICSKHQSKDDWFRNNISIQFRGIVGYVVLINAVRALVDFGVVGLVWKHVMLMIPLSEDIVRYMLSIKTYIQCNDWVTALFKCKH